MALSICLLLLQALSSHKLDGLIDTYSIDARIDPASGGLEATATLTLTVPEDGLASLEFLLNEGLEVADVRSDMAIRSVTRHADRSGEFQFAPTAVPVEVAFRGELQPGRSLTVSVSYAGVIVGDPWGANRVTEGWVELGMYAAWFPLMPHDEAFTSRVRVTLDSTYTVTGTGRVSEGTSIEGVRAWLLEQSLPSNDIVVIAGPGLRRHRLGSGATEMSLYESGLDPSRVDRILSDVENLVASETTWFGNPGPLPLTVVLAKRDRGGGYTRPGLVVVTYDGDPDTYTRFAKGLAHEISHLWWSGAPTTTWEDWLNESFAEYSALVWIRTHMGEGVFADHMEAYAEQSRDLPPIRNMARDQEAAYAVLYRKGPLVLFALEEAMGRDSFLSLLRTVHTDHVRSTEGLFELVRRTASREAMRVLEDGLAR